METTKSEVLQLMSGGWIKTDPSCNQMMKEIVKDKEYSFREDRIINPVTKETRLYEETLEWEDYEAGDIIDVCQAFGYSRETIELWISTGKEIPLMLECIFELSCDSWY